MPRRQCQRGAERMSDHMTNPYVCPVTGKPRTDLRLFTWTDHSKPGLFFNSCPTCCPDGPTSAAPMLRRLEASRRRRS